DEAEAERHDDDRHDSEAVEAVGQVHRIARANDDEGTEQHEKPTERQDQVLKERKGEGTRERLAAERDDEIAGDERVRRLDGESDLAGEASMRLLGDLEEVVIEAD